MARLLEPGRATRRHGRIAAGPRPSSRHEPKPQRLLRVADARSSSSSGTPFRLLGSRREAPEEGSGFPLGECEEGSEVARARLRIVPPRRSARSTEGPCEPEMIRAGLRAGRVSYSSMYASCPRSPRLWQSTDVRAGAFLPHHQWMPLVSIGPRIRRLLMAPRASMSRCLGDGHADEALAGGSTRPASPRPACRPRGSRRRPSPASTAWLFTARSTLTMPSIKPFDTALPVLHGPEATRDRRRAPSPPG